MGRVAVVVSVMLIACAGPPPPKPPEPVVAAPVRIDVPAATAPAWLEPPLPDGIDDPFAPIALRALGTKSAVISTRAGWFVAHLETGVTGPITIPDDAIWVGIGGDDDQVFAARPDGTLVAVGGNTLGRVKGATVWAASHHLIVAAAGERVHVSRDGVKFRSQPVAKGFIAKELFARVDGVIVAFGSVAGEAHPVTFVSKTGATWKRSAFQPAGIVQEGGMIRSSDSDCVHAVMSAGSTEWVAQETHPDVVRMTRMLDHSSTGAAPREYETSMTPAPPYDPQTAVTGTSEICARIVGSDEVPEDRHRAFDDLVGLQRSPPTRTALALLHDGKHVLSFDRATGASRVLDPPCAAPRAAHAVRGLAVLVCDTDVYVWHEDAWHHEAAVGDTVAVVVGGEHGVAVADDGTAGLFLFDRVAIRSPAAPGEGTWRPVAIPRAVIARLLPGGDVVALAGKSPDLSLVRVSPDGESVTLAAGIKLSEYLVGFDVDGTAQLHFESGTRTIWDDGTLR